ncbi:hypothetical protein HDE78_001542 [Rhodanobacter sp. K2T2]|uniref:hypothetical protein n=1 Tax=Rhodanobacter sp. K2T2 TaxID=2723085 RepID=UPI0015CA74AC|nr:hypothetical protein [Rhodanobacter sp. K2T2]NYE28586.1 hypothetical protein [Rhodanobacter sp. K2T2]
MTANQKVRIFFRTGTVDRPVCWFEMREADLYYGPSDSSGIDVEPVDISGKSVQVTMPDSVRRIEGGGFKASYHASGEFHTKVSGRGSRGLQSWPKKAEIDEPFRVAALITRLPHKYAASNRSHTRGGASAIILNLPGDQEPSRHYLEFFISPPGQFPIPTTLIESHGTIGDSPICHSMNDELILVIRHLVFAQTMDIHRWQPDREIWLFAQPVNDDGAGT